MCVMKSFLNVGNDWSEERLRFVRQIGVEGVVAHPAPSDPDPGFYDLESLVALRTRVESFGLEFFGIRLLPWTWTRRLPGKWLTLPAECPSSPT